MRTSEPEASAQVQVAASARQAEGSVLPPPPTPPPGSGDFAFATVLEAANDLRIRSGAPEISGRDEVPKGQRGDNDNGCAAAAPSSEEGWIGNYDSAIPAPTLEEISEALSGSSGGVDVAAVAPSLEELADALSDDEDPVFDDSADASSLEGDREDSGMPAYTAETVAAISSLMKGKESAKLAQAVESDGGAPRDSKRDEGPAPQSKRKITLQDRAAGLITVYKDYLQEEDCEDEGEVVSDDQYVEHLRRQEIKVATLEKFCSGMHTEGLDAERQRIDVAHPPPRPTRLFWGPTAATTTAAFRLKAEVALRGVRSRTANVARKAAGAVKTRVRDSMMKHEVVDLHARDNVENDYDYQDYHKNISDEHNADIIQEDRRNDTEYGVFENNEQQQSLNADRSDDDGGMVYGMHILDRDRVSLKRKHPLDEEDLAFNEMCDELGVTPESHPSLRERYFYQRPRSSRYMYPIFRTKKFKRSLMYAGALMLLLIIVVSILSAVSNGFEGVRKQPLPDWKAEEEWRERQKLKWEKEHGDTGFDGDGLGGGPTKGKDGTTAAAAASPVQHHSTHQALDQAMHELFQSVSAAYRPVWYDRSTGWTGRTFAEALSWCDSHDGYVPCPYEVYCPDGKTLLADVMDNNAPESWAPIIEWGEWVQVGAGQPCALYSESYGEEHPGWGKDGLDDEEITRHIMCCRESPIKAGGGAWEDDRKVEGEHWVRPDGPPSLLKAGSEHQQSPGQQQQQQQHNVEVDTEILFLSVTKNFSPIWFDRDTGWTGQTYEDSLQFCDSLGGGYGTCPYDVYCPGGRGKLLGGSKGWGESWSAVIESNDWVQVGQDGEAEECTLYSETSKEPPSWGITGNDNEEITRHIMCCQGVPPEGASESSVSDNYDKDTAGPSLVTMPEPSHTLTELEVQITQTYHPAWFDGDLGWSGTSYEGARAFCESISHGQGFLHLCPLSVYCPNGPRAFKPLYLQMDAFEGVQWAPVSTPENGWVMVGRFSDDRPLTCETYLDINHHHPDWGLDGSSPELKEHLLCCVDATDSDGSIAKGDVDGDFIDDAYDKHLSGTQQQSEKSGNYIEEESASHADKESSSDMGMNNDGISSSMTSGEVHILEAHHPAWFSREFGWTGTSYDDARAFCESIPHGEGDTLHLCPVSAYCPNGLRRSEPLYLQMDAFEGVQWAPVGHVQNGWVMVGDVDGLTCQTYSDINHRDPVWGLDGSSEHLKQHILCCEDNNGDDSFVMANGAPSDGGVGDLLTDMIGTGMHNAGVDVSDDGVARNESDTLIDATKVGKTGLENSLARTFNPIWFDVDRGGWDGGSHDDGVLFCEKFAGSHGKRMELCPYAAYCPEGPSKRVIGGHMVNFDEEGEQWAPVYGQANHWVLIGMRAQNPATTCLSHFQLKGTDPAWGLDNSNREMKKHIMCCSPFQ